MKKIVRLTESDLHRIIKESVNRIIKESDYMNDKPNIIIFDAYGEYTNAFSNLTKYNPNILYKTY